MSIDMIFDAVRRRYVGTRAVSRARSAGAVGGVTVHLIGRKRNGASGVWRAGLQQTNVPFALTEIGLRIASGPVVGWLCRRWTTSSMLPTR